MSSVTICEPTNACAQFPNLFSSPYLDDFDEEDFRETQNAHAGADEEGLSADEWKERLELLVQVAREEHMERQPRTISAAKEICGGCPLLSACHKKALSIKPDEIYGVMAGMTRSERVSAQSAARRAKARALRAQKSIDVETTMALSREDVRRIEERLLSR